MLASKLFWIYFQSNSMPRAPTHKKIMRVKISSAKAHPSPATSTLTCPLPATLWIIKYSPTISAVSTVNFKNSCKQLSNLNYVFFVKSLFGLKWFHDIILRSYLSLTVIKSNGTSRFGSSSSSADTGKNVAKNSILANCVIMYITPAVTHFQKAPYSDLKLTKIHVIWYMCQNWQLFF